VAASGRAAAEALRARGAGRRLLELAMRPGAAGGAAADAALLLRELLERGNARRCAWPALDSG